VIYPCWPQHFYQKTPAGLLVPVRQRPWGQKWPGAGGCSPSSPSHTRCEPAERVPGGKSFSSPFLLLSQAAAAAGACDQAMGLCYVQSCRWLLESGHGWSLAPEGPRRFRAWGSRSCACTQERHAEGSTFSAVLCSETVTLHRVTAALQAQSAVSAGSWPQRPGLGNPGAQAGRQPCPWPCPSLAAPSGQASGESPPPPPPPPARPA